MLCRACVSNDQNTRHGEDNLPVLVITIEIISTVDQLNGGTIYLIIFLIQIPLNPSDRTFSH